MGTNKVVVTDEARLSYPHLFRPAPDLQGNPCYSANLLMDADGVKKLKAIWDEVVTEEFGEPNPPGLRPFLSKNPAEDKGWVKSGDQKIEMAKPEKRPQLEYLRGLYVVPIKAAPERKPKIVDQNKQEIMDVSELQGGDYVRAVLEMSAYTDKFQRPQVSVRVVVVQKTRDGERFGGGVSPNEALDLLDGGTSSASLDDLGL